MNKISILIPCFGSQLRMYRATRGLRSENNRLRIIFVSGFFKNSFCVRYAKKDRRVKLKPINYVCLLKVIYLTQSLNVEKPDLLVKVT